MHIIGYIFALLIGLTLGLIGGGGSIITVPVLVYFFGIEPLLAGTYSLIIVAITSAAGVSSHILKSDLDLKTACWFGIPCMAVVFIFRKWIMPVIPHYIGLFYGFELTKPVLLMAVFALLMIIVSFFMITDIHSGKARKPSVETDYKRLLMLSVGVGCITGFVGVGGGFLIIPSLVMFAGLPMKKAVGTSLLIIAISAGLGVLPDVVHDNNINYRFLLRFCLLAVAGILAGTYFSRFLPESKLKLAFGWFVLVMGIAVLYSVLR